MKSNHLSLVVWHFSTIVAFSPFVMHAADSGVTPPAATLLQAGDLIWPKKPGTIIPNNSRPGEADKSDTVRWAKGKEDYLNKSRHNPNASDQQPQRYAEVHRMTYTQ